MSRPATVDKAGERTGYQNVKTLVMRRSLVLTTESARHPFRVSLPPHVLALDGPPLRRLLAEDAKGFAMTYFACFVAVLAFIA